MNDFDRNEILLLFPIVTQSIYSKVYKSNNIAIPLYSLQFDKLHFVLINHVRTISKSRIIKEYKSNDDELVKISNKDLIK